MTRTQTQNILATQKKYTYAQIDETGICIGQSVLSGEINSANMIAIAADQNVLGMLWDGEEFQPVEAEIDVTPPNLTLLEFRQLFTLRERMTIDNADSLLPVDAIDAKVMLKTLMTDLSASTFIDPLNPDILQGLAFLSAKGILDHEQRGIEILCKLRNIDEDTAAQLLTAS